VWDMESWKVLAVVADAHEPMALSPDGRRLACGTATNLAVWTLDGSVPEVLLKDSTNLFSRQLRLGRSFRSDRADRLLEFSPDGKMVVGARNMLSDRGVFVLSVWDARTGEETDVMPANADHIEHAGTITDMAFSPDGHMLATASMDHSIRLWDFATRQPTEVIQGHLSEVMALAFTPDGRTIVSAAKDGEIKVWPTVRRAPEDVLIGVRHPVGFSKDGGRVMALTRDWSALVLVNMETKEPELRLELRVDGEARRPESEARPSRDFERRLEPSGRRPDTERGRESRLPRPFFARSFMSDVVASTDLRWLTRGREDGVVEWINVQTMRTNLLHASESSVRVVALSPDGQTLITRSREQGMRKWDLPGGTNIVWRNELEPILFSPDGRTVAVAGRPDGRGPQAEEDAVQLWDVGTLTLRVSLESPNQVQFGFAGAFSADSRLIALPDEEDAVRLWDVRTGELVGTCTGHKQGIRSIAFSPDNRTLATTSDDSTVKLWNVATKQELISMRHLGATLTGLMFSPDGRVLVGGSGALGPNGGIKIYRAAGIEEIDFMSPVSNAPEAAR
jgi:WD40 repeat protein